MKNLFKTYDDYEALAAVAISVLAMAWIVFEMIQDKVYTW